MERTSQPVTRMKWHEEAIAQLDVVLARWKDGCNAVSVVETG